MTDKKTFTVTVACRTRGCENRGVDLEIDAVDGMVVICGPCGKTIVKSVKEPSNGDD